MGHLTRPWKIILKIFWVLTASRDRCATQLECFGYFTLGPTYGYLLVSTKFFNASELGGDLSPASVRQETRSAKLDIHKVSSLVYVSLGRSVVSGPGFRWGQARHWLSCHSRQPAVWRRPTFQRFHRLDLFTDAKRLIDRQFKNKNKIFSHYNLCKTEPVFQQPIRPGLPLSLHLFILQSDYLPRIFSR